MKADTIRAALAGAVFLASVAWLTRYSWVDDPSILQYAIPLSIGGAVVTLCLWRADTLSARTVMLLAIAGHGIALFGNTVFEDDFYRFIWDGWRVLETGTPYGIAPLQFYDDLSIPADMQEVLDWINYPELSTIYGPTLQLSFTLNSALFGSDPLGLRLLFGFASLMVVALSLRRFSPSQVALFAWNPLVVAETTLHLHPDILMGLPIVGALLLGRRYPALAGAMLGLAAGVKLVALAAWPMLLRLPPRALIAAVVMLAALYAIFAVQGQGVGFGTTAVFASDWYFNPFAFVALDTVFGPDLGRMASLLLAGTLVLWAHAKARNFEQVPLAYVFGAILLFAPTVNAWYLLWVLPFAIGSRDIWPYVASAVLPLSYLTGLNLDDPALGDFEVHPLAAMGQWIAIAVALCADGLRHITARASVPQRRAPIENPNVTAIIPALNEEASIGKTVRGIIEAAPSGLNQVIVADNGSTDCTAQIAREAGAVVVHEAERGYGAACLAGLSALPPETDIILFMDADLSDVPEEAQSLIDPIISGDAQIVIGSRALGKVEQGAMTAPQRLGNWLAPALVRAIWGVRYTDLGPFRAIERRAFDSLAMADRDFGWTIEMQVRAAKTGLRVAERPVSYRRRVGQSKISGTIRGVFAAGAKILFVIAREAFGDFGAAEKRKRPVTIASAAPQSQV